MPRITALLIALAGLSASLCALPAAAQDDARWYKVELMVFSNAGGADGERWDPTPALAYPDKLRFLVHPERIEALREAHEGPSELDGYGVLTLLPPPVIPDTPDIPRLGPDETLAAPEQAAAAERETGPGEAEAEPPTRPTPFIALPAAQREFRGKAAYMERSGEYHILFHETWVQPVVDEARAVPIALDRSGDGGPWPQLQGSVTLSVSRYLHIQTNLWLNTTGDYLPGDWRMPAPPLAPPSVIEVPPEPPLEAPGATAGENLAGMTGSAAEEMPGAEPPEQEPAPVYPWRHAVLMQQDRRMRSLEVHYIDHPLFGVVVKLTPLDDETLRAMAAAEVPLATRTQAEAAPAR